MSLRPQEFQAVPEETARIAQAAFPKGNLYMQMHDEMGVIYADQDFASLFPVVGQPAETPWRLALVLVMQFMENLTDRQAANAVRGRIDWKYALGLELSDPGFDFSILSEFRDRLVKGQVEAILLDRILEQFRLRGWVKAGGKQRTDSTHILAVVHNLNRLELVGRTLQAVLEEMAKQVPSWLQEQITPDWFDRYSRIIEEYRLPKKATERKAFAERIGKDGQYLLTRLDECAPFPQLRELDIVHTLRTVWEQQYEVRQGQLRWRDQESLPSSGERISSPFDLDVRLGVKRDIMWAGYKVHLTETCGENCPHVITHVETAKATEADVFAIQAIHQDLAQKDLLPAEHMVDAGYISGGTISTSQIQFGVDLFGPVRRDTSWQAHTANALDITHFTVDWENQQVRCPAGHTNRDWRPKTLRGQPNIVVRFSPIDCHPCSLRARCTRSKKGAREITLLSKQAHQALELARQYQKTDEFTQRYAARAGIEGTLSQAISTLGLRRSRYIGLAKTHLQHILTATALNLIRIVAWINQVPTAITRQSYFAALAPA
jgi:transposase